LTKCRGTSLQELASDLKEFERNEKDG